MYTTLYYIEFLDSQLYLKNHIKDSRIVQKRKLRMEANQLQKYIAERIRECRKEQNLSQEQLSNQAGLGIKAIQNIENMKYDFKIHTLEKVLTALGMTVEDFFNFPLSNNSVPITTLIDNISDLSHTKKLKIISLFNEIVKNID